MSYVCPNCRDAEVIPQDGTHWLACPGCGRGYDEDDLADYYDRKEVKDLTREIQACFDQDVNRPRASGGGDDGLSMTWDIPQGDETIVKVTVQRITVKAHVLRVKGLRCTTQEFRDAIADLVQP